MDELIEFIKSTINIPCIEQNEAVMDGSFALSPYMSQGLSGNGEIASVTNYYAIDIFFEDKKLAVENAITLWKALNANKKYCSQSPDYTYEQDAEMWHAVVRAQEVIND